MSDTMKVENNRINPIALTAAAAAGGAVGMMAKPAYTKAKTAILAMNDDSFVKSTALGAKKQLNRLGGFLSRHLGREALKGYWTAITTKFSGAKKYVSEKASAVYHSAAMKKVGAFLKHPATIGVAAGAALYVAAKKILGEKNSDYID